MVRRSLSAVACCFQQCPICQEHRASQIKDPMIQTDIPPRPCHTVGVDLFHLDGEEYLLIADYYSKFPFVRKLSSQMGSTHVTTLLKQIFSEQGIPQIVRSNNRPQFASHAFAEFCQSYGFNHSTSSPHYPRSNCFIESQVKIVKATLQKI